MVRLVFFFLQIPENIHCFFIVVFLLLTFPSPIAAHAQCLLHVLPKKELVAAAEGKKKSLLDSVECFASGRRCDMNQPPTCETLPSMGGWPGEALLCVLPHNCQPCRPAHSRHVVGTVIVRLHQGEFNIVANLLAEVERLGLTL